MLPVPEAVPICSFSSSSASKQSKRHKFSKDEDEKLKAVIERIGTTNWADVAKEMPGRSSRQCRERYRNYLAPHLRNDLWTFEEDLCLQHKVAEHGQKWATIAKYFPGRSDVNVKNHWTILSQRISKMSEYRSDKYASLFNNLYSNQHLHHKPGVARLLPLPQIDFVAAKQKITKDVPMELDFVDGAFESFDFGDLALEWTF